MKSIYMNKNISLVIMAAGLGSRYKNGTKQLQKIGPNGETIMDYSINDAKEAGFNEVVFILRKEILDEFKEVIGNRVSEKIKTRYVFQETNNIKNEYLNIERTKPWGTGHAILMLENMDNPFVVINADDYYGKGGLKNLYNFLINQDNDSYNYCMAGFILKNTLSDNGGVSRGICTVKNGYLEDIVETHDINKDTSISIDSVVSMNMWGFTPTILKELEIRFDKFLKENSTDLKKEFLLPVVVNELIKEKKVSIKVLPSYDKWYGITFSEDLDNVKKAFKKFYEKGIY